MKARLDIKSNLKLDAILKQHPEHRDRALTRAGLALWGDAVNVAPKPPIDTGLLRGSGNLFVSGKRVSAPADIQSDPSAQASPEGGTGEVVVGFNTPYAARLHELASYEKHNVPGINAGSGPQFLRSKINRYGREYVRVASEAIKEWLS